MTLPVPMLPPSVSVWANNVMLADGRAGGDPLAPMVLDQLRVQWGRATILDQPPPSTCTMTMMDVLGGQSFLDVVGIGYDLKVRADATISPDPDQSGSVVVISLDFTSSTPPPIVTSNAGYSIQGGKLYAWALDGTRAAVLTFPPGAPEPVGGNPAAWDAIPRSSQGQTWMGSAVRVTPAPAFAGWNSWATALQPVTYDSPWATPRALAPLGAGGLFVPPDGVWLGLRVTLFPTGPMWNELDSTSWDGLSPGGPTRTNRATNPRAVSTGADGWTSFRGFGGGAAGTYSYATGITGPAGTGITTCRRKAWTVGSNTVINDTGHDVRDTSALYFPVTPGQTVTMSGWLRMTSATQKPAQIAWVFYSALTNAGTNVGAGTGPVVNLASGTWARITATALVPAGAAGLRVVLDVDGNGTAVWAAGDTLDGTGLLIELAGTAGAYFDGDTPDAPGTVNYAWSGTPNASTSTAVATPAWTWDALSRFSIDDVKLTAPPAGTVRSALVFSGRITDMEARFDGGATLIDITAQDQRAELANRDVGDQPWLAERLDARVARIISASGQPISYHIDTSAAGLQVSWRDVDRQGALTLLQEMAITGDAVLWAAAHLTTGPYLDFEALNERPSLSGLSQGADSVVIIGPITDVPGSVELAACDLGREPVRWIQDVADVATRVAITWREQTLDDKGQPSPTDRVVTQTDPTLEGKVGTRRIAISTQLAVGANASTLSINVLGRTSMPGWRLSGVTWEAEVNAPMNSDALARMMTLLDGTTRNGCPVVVTDLPPWSPVAGKTEIPLFVEGGTYTSSGGAWVLDLITSAPTAAGRSVTWAELPSTPHPVTAWRWQDFHPSIRWVDLAGVSVD